MRRGTTALLVIDMQYGDADRDHGLIGEMRHRGDFSADYYIDRVESTVVPNIRRLLDAFRSSGLEVIHTRIRSLTADGRDRSPEHKRLGMHWPPGSIESELLPEVAAIGDEIVLSKTCGGVFNGTNLHYVLRNLGIETLIIVGVVASGCVEVAVRDAADLGYSVVLVEDATATLTPNIHDTCMQVLDEVFAKVKRTDDVLSAIHASGGARTLKAPMT